MPELLINLDPDSRLNLQQQIRQKLVELILSGVLPEHSKVPSSRKLAKQLNIARNTVTLAYQQLIEEGYLQSHQRSGNYVSANVLDGRTTHYRNPKSAQPFVQINKRPANSNRRKEDWKQFDYPLLDTEYDASLFPTQEWREASRLALNVADIEQWSNPQDRQDDPKLLEEIRTKLLPRRGIHVSANNILITSGRQQSLYLIANTKLQAGDRLIMEEPGNPQILELARQRQAIIQFQALDKEGMTVSQQIPLSTAVYVTPSHQLPTNITMTANRREQLLAACQAGDSIIIEDDSNQEHVLNSNAQAAIFSLDKKQQTIYLSNLSDALNLGLQLAYVVGPKDWINTARQLRQQLGANPAPNNQRTMAYFLSLGHYDSFVRQLDAQFKLRWTSLRDAINYKLHALAKLSLNQSGTAMWLTLHQEIDLHILIKQAAQQGVLIEDISLYYHQSPLPPSVLRLGITSLGNDKIPTAIDILARIIRQLGTAQAAPEIELLHGDALQHALSDTKITSKTVYGESYTISVKPDGTLYGECREDTSDQDTGSWRIEGAYFYRRWDNWLYGHETGFRVGRLGNTVYWLNQDQQVIDTGELDKQS